MSTTFDLSKPNRVVHVGVVLTGGVTEILDVAPVDLFSSISQKVKEFPDVVIGAEFKNQAIDIEFHWVNENGDIAQLTAGLRVLATDSFATCPALDVVIMGANNIDYQPNENELAFIRKSYDACSAFITICGGVQAALKAGLLDGKSVTGPLPLLETYRKMFPHINWEQKRWQRDGKLWTSGTLLNGLDLMRAFGEETYGAEGTLMGRALEVGAWPIRDVSLESVKA